MQDSELQGEQSGGDLLSLLLEEKAPDGMPAFSRAEVHDEVTFLSTFCKMLYCLGWRSSLHLYLPHAVSRDCYSCSLNACTVTIITRASSLHSGKDWAGALPLLSCCLSQLHKARLPGCLTARRC